MLSKLRIVVRVLPIVVVVWREILGTISRAKNMGYLVPICQRSVVETAQKRLRNGRERPNGTKCHQNSMLGITLSIFTLRMPMFANDVGGEKYGVSYVVFVCAT